VAHDAHVAEGALVEGEHGREQGRHRGRVRLEEDVDLDVAAVVVRRVAVGRSDHGISAGGS
jgi:hypothetical protein